MRCIEIYIRRELEEYKCVININMRCIEMVKNQSMRKKRIKININMRCIEIEKSYQKKVDKKGLTLT